jgi:FkbM family methyltransferase
LDLTHNFIDSYSKEIQKIWDNINKSDRKLLVSLIAYRILGYKKVKLPRNNSEYWEAIKIAKSLANNIDTYDPHFLHYKLKKYDLSSIGFDLQFYFTDNGVALDFILEQYAYKIKNKNIVAVEKGDVVLDLGACWGDTALYFASNTGSKGQGYSFEFIPDNLKLFEINTGFNPIVLSRIKLITNPVSSNSGNVIYYKDNGPSSKVSFDPFEGQTGSALTISIDDFVSKNGITKVDFIKMDIEGAELKALEGALKTIQQFKPKLAIAMYHNMEDFATIPNWILDLNLDYNIFIGHYTIHSEETICFAKV